MHSMYYYWPKIPATIVAATACPACNHANRLTAQISLEILSATWPHHLTAWRARSTSVATLFFIGALFRQSVANATILPHSTIQTENLWELRNSIFQQHWAIVRHYYMAQSVSYVYHAGGSQVRGCQGARKMATGRLSCRQRCNWFSRQIILTGQAPVLQILTTVIWDFALKE